MNKNNTNRPTFPIVRVASTTENEDNDDDFDDLNDLQFMTSIDGEEMMQPNVTLNYYSAASGNNNDNNRQQVRKVVEPLEIEEEYSFQPVRVNDEEMESSKTASTVTTNATASSRSSTTAPNLFSNVVSRWFSSATADPPTNGSTTTNTTTTTTARMFFHTTLSNTRLGQMLQESSHPGVAIFHVIFKLLALLTYIFGGWLAGASNFVTITVICIILLACDFWVVKNVSGRLLVGLRWWNKVEEDGSTKWIFESAEHAYNNSFDKTVFWGVIYATPIVWGLLFIVGFFRLHFGWLIVVIVALTLSFSNVYGYWKCSSDQKVKLSHMISTGAQMGMTSAMEHNVLGKMSQAIATAHHQQQQQQQQYSSQQQNIGMHPSGKPLVSSYTR